MKPATLFALVLVVVLGLLSSGADVRVAAQQPAVAQQRQVLDRALCVAQLDLDALPGQQLRVARTDLRLRTAR